MVARPFFGLKSKVHGSRTTDIEDLRSIECQPSGYEDDGDSSIHNPSAINKTPAPIFT